MTPAERVIAERATAHMPKPAHNMFAREITKALDAAGYVIVPKEPTKEMVEAGNIALENETDSDWDSGSDGESHNSYTIIRSTAPHSIYTAMIKSSAT